MSKKAGKVSEVKRLQPTTDTLRELYLKSGNQCAFPDCNHLMMNSEGVFIGQICHIEAAEKGGERFNDKQSNEDRRHFSNLMLMCYEHHAVTNDLSKFSPSKLKAMKAAHEAKFSDIANAIGNVISDSSDAIAAVTPTTLQKMNATLQWNLDPNQLAALRDELLTELPKIRALPIRTRQLLVIIVSRLNRRVVANNRYRYELHVPFREVAEAANLADLLVEEHMGILSKYGIGEVVDNVPRTTRLQQLASGWDLWGDLREFCDRTGEPLRAILVDLEFNRLD